MSVEIRVARDADELRRRARAAPRASSATSRACPLEDELDGRDDEALHLVAVDATATVVGTCRLLVRRRARVKLGRLAVDRAARRRGIAALLLAEAERWARDAGARRIVLHAQTYAARLYARAGYERRRRAPSWRPGSSTSRWRSALPEVRVDPLTGAAGDRRRPSARRAPARGLSAEPRRADRPRARPVRRGPRGPHAAGGLRAAPGRRRAGHARAGPCASCPTSTRRWPRTRPSPSRRAAPTCSPRAPRAGAHEVIVNAPAAGRRRSPSCRAEQVAAAIGRVARAHARARRRRLRAPARQRAPRGRRLAAAHARAALRARTSCRAVVARERERFGAYATRTMGGNLLADLVQEEVRRRERDRRDRRRGGRCWRPTARACRTSCMLAPRRAARALRGRRADRRGAAARRAAAARAPASARSPPLNLWVRTAPRGAEHFCWRIDIVPRLTHLAGLELGTGVHLNIVAPEQAAAELREV